MSAGSGPPPRVLSIAGTDPTGGAGIHADLKSFAALGGYGMAVVTSLVAQNTQGVRSVHTPPADFLRAQLEAVSDDVRIDAVKIGMLADVSTIAVVRDWLQRTQPPVVVLDPVMVTTSGDRLLQGDAEAALRELVASAHLVTPNVPELAVLVDQPPAVDWSEALEQGMKLSRDSQAIVLVKGGHLDMAESPDALVDAAGRLDGEKVVEFSSARVATRNTHGTGCSLSSGMATAMARTGNWAQALSETKDWLQDALASSDELQVGEGSGPIHHFHRLWSTAAPQGDAFSTQLWAEIAGTREAIYDLDFVRQLADGTLEAVDFDYYLNQDAQYLSRYSRALARASQLAPAEAEQLFWAAGSSSCLEVEADLHRNWLQDRAGRGETGPVTRAYTDHLLAAAGQGSYAVLVAAVLPCFWLYADVGAVLHQRHAADPNRQDHPYSAWLETYADEAFAAATRQAIEIMDSAARNASAGERELMRQAFIASARYEYEFFDAPRLRRR